MNSREVPGKQKEVTIMRKYHRFSVSLVLWLFFFAIGSHTAGAQSSLQSIDSPQGGKIVYGLVDGATTQAAAMSKVLRIVHNNCGERPQVGRVFRVRGTDSVAVFFTVVNRPQGNKPVAGEVIAVPSGPNQIEAALVSDDATRFGSSLNPMLNQLFSVWHPGGAGQASGPAAGGHSALAATLRTVAASDNSVSIGVPDGWTLDPRSSGGTIHVTGPQGQDVALGMNKSGVDPTHPWQRNFARMGGRPLPGQIVYPYHGNLVQAFPGLFQAWRRSNGLGPAKLEIEKIDPFPVPQGSPLGRGEECVVATGHLDPDGQGMRTMSDLMCAALPVDWGGYPVTLNHHLVPDALVEQDKATFGAMLSSWKENAEVLKQQTAEAGRQKAASDQETRAWGQQAVANINAIGQRAAIRNDAVQAANDAQHAGYWAQQDSNARTSQAFSNYILDQTVIQDNNMYGNGTIGHGTVWNSEADRLVKADPNRFEIVDTPNFWKGWDYY
ncbi:MAG: hypothetical protein ACLQOO_13760 [Terriglobia bacterium]